MTSEVLLIGLAGVLAAAGPMVFASIGEAITERAGITNLSMNGLILLTAMGGFAACLATGSLLMGFLAGAVIGGAVSAIVAFASITLKQSQVAVGFILAMLCRDLSYFLGNPIMGQPGPRLGQTTVPLLREVPVLGPLLFRQDLMTYASYLLIVVAWLYVNKTRPGLVLRGLGEKPAAAYARGVNVNALRYLYTIAGGALAGIAGPMYSLSIKAGWKGTITGLDGIGWIALAITIFGGWSPIKIACGAWFFALLQWLGIVLQPALPGVPSQVLQVAPFPLMILTLLFVNMGNAGWVESMLARLPEKPRRALARFLRSTNVKPPAALGTPFEKD
jgi:general nucleoside transport system permease protein